MTAEEATSKFLKYFEGQRRTAENYLAHHATFELGANLGNLQEMPLAAAAVILGDEFDKRIRKVFDRICVEGVSAPDREARLKKLEAEKRAIEIEEERAVMKLEDQGYAVPRRRNVDPALIWEVWTK